MASPLEPTQAAGLARTVTEQLGTAAEAIENTITHASAAVVRPKKKKQRRVPPGRPAKSQRDAAPRKIQQDWSRGLNWPIVLWLGLVHAGALAAPFYFTWKAVLLTVALHWLTGGIGVCLGYHRYLTHGSFQTYKPVRWLLALIGGLSGEGSAMFWVANHRKHHEFSDQEGDPHSPRDGAWWSHMLWVMPNHGKKYNHELADRYAPDLARERAMHVLDWLFIPSHFAMGALLLTVGWWGWDFYTGMSFLVWGLFVRMVAVLHSTWLVNSATHMWGYRNYPTTDDSRNLWWVALVTYGEGWHNNHHKFQRMARHGHKWWEFDLTYWTILAMERCGLAWKVVHDVRERRAYQ